MSWVHESKLTGADLAKLKLREKDKLHEESRYLLITENTLFDLIMGIRDLFKEAAEAVIYHIFREAGERKAQSLLSDMKDYQAKKAKDHKLTGEHIYSHRFSREAVLQELLEELAGEGYFREAICDISHSAQCVSLRIVDPFCVRLLEIGEKQDKKITESEASAALRGMLAGVFSALTGKKIDIKECEISREEGVAICDLPQEVYEEMYKPK